MVDPARHPSAWLLGFIAALTLCSPAAPAAPASPSRLPPPSSAGAMVPVEWSAVAGRSAAGTPQGRLILAVGAARLVLPFPTVAHARQDGARLAARLALLGSTRLSLREVAAGSYAGTPALTWRGRVVLPLTNAQGRDLGRPPAAVVASWAVSLHRVATDARRPTGLPREIQVPCGESRLLTLPATWLGGAARQVEDPTVASVTPSPSSPAASPPAQDLRVMGLTPGVTHLRLERGGRQAEIEIRVQAKAGTLPARLEVSIAGTAGDDALLVDATEHTLEHEARVQPGAELTTFWGGPPGRMMQAPLRLTAWLEGPGLAPVVQAVNVSGCRSSLRFAPASHLAASNHPERLEQAGRLLDVNLGTGTNAWYFHHQNAGDALPRALQTRLENRSDRPVLLLVAVSAAGPSRDELYAGHLAAWRYLHRYTAGQGWQVRLRPGQRYVLDERLLRPRDVACGMGQVMVAEGPPPALVVESLDEGPLQDAAQPPDARQPGGARAGQAIIRARGIFGPPQVVVEASYAVDGPYTFIPVGGPPFQQPLGDGTPNTGNYGVEYQVSVHMSNPTPSERRVWVVFAAAGGAARGSLDIDGRLVETPVLSTAPGKPREFGLGDYTLPPGSTRDVRVRVMPEPGSNYPVRLIVKPLAPNQ